MNKDTEEILKSFNLEFKEVQPNVIKIINTYKLVNVDDLRWKLKKCMLVTSKDVTVELLECANVVMSIAHVYYIILDIDNKELHYKYCDIARKQYDSVIPRYNIGKLI